MTTKISVSTNVKNRHVRRGRFIYWVSGLSVENHFSVHAIASELQMQLEHPPIWTLRNNLWPSLFMTVSPSRAFCELLNVIDPSAIRPPVLIHYSEIGSASAAESLPPKRIIKGYDFDKLLLVEGVFHRRITIFLLYRTIFSSAARTLSVNSTLLFRWYAEIRTHPIEFGVCFARFFAAFVKSHLDRRKKKCLP